ncbi:MAG: hypothetical protein M0Z28_13780 [Rhodospirillales bacterium]|nr:hypothetical protein [Rhodospirillales bacterium]
MCPAADERADAASDCAGIGWGAVLADAHGSCRQDHGVSAGEHRMTGAQRRLRRSPQVIHASSMFAIDDATAMTVRHAFDEHGELAAAVELRRHFPGIGDLAWARELVRIILRWQPIPGGEPIDPR